MTEATFSTIIPFRDIDMHGHMHNASYLAHFEAAISDFITCHHLNDFFNPASRDILFVVKKAEVTYFSPLTYGDHVQICVEISHLGRSSLGFSCEMKIQDQIYAQSIVTWVCMDFKTKQSLPIHDDLRMLLQPLCS